MTVDEIVSDRKISEVLHFTTNNGVLGVLRSSSLLAHSELPLEESLEHIAHINCPDRTRDREHHSYVNLSISRINASFFSISKNKWHATKDVFWCILSFSPEIMSHGGVLFATTNNAYDCARRAPGPNGLEALFASEVRIFYDKVTRRAARAPLNFTTCPQAEVLYPKSVSTDYLQCVYVPSDEIASELEAQIGWTAPELLERVAICVRDEKFR